jgi:hypothetical protein
MRIDVSLGGQLMLKDLTLLTIAMLPAALPVAARSLQVQLTLLMSQKLV